MKKYLFETSVVLLSIALILNIRSWNFIKTYSGMGSETWPLIILAAIVALSVLQVLLSVFRPDKAPPVSFENMTRQVLVVIALLGAYIYSLEYIGFLIGTLVFQWIFIGLINRYRNKLYLLAPVGVTAAIFLLFVKVMYVPLPRGMGLFRAFSSLFY